MPLPETAAYVQVTRRLRGLALATPWEADGLLPPEPVLAERFHVSRGTLRRATEELTREGLLLVERGRGTYVNRPVQLRMRMREALAAIALPDSRWHLDVLKYVPDFADSAKAHERIRGNEGYRSAATVFIAPDNSLAGLISRALADGKRLVVPTYGMRRGMVLLDPAKIAPENRDFAATLDGLERFGSPLALPDLRALGAIDLVVTGGLAFTTDGVHIGSGDAYLDIEWAILAEVGLVTARTPILGVAHATQVVDAHISPTAAGITVDAIATPEGLVATGPGHPRPTGVDWSRVPPGRVQIIAYLADLSPLPDWNL